MVLQRETQTHRHRLLASLGAIGTETTESPDIMAADVTGETMRAGVWLTTDRQIIAPREKISGIRGIGTSSQGASGEEIRGLNTDSFQAMQFKPCQFSIGFLTGFSASFTPRIHAAVKEVPMIFEIYLSSYSPLKMAQDSTLLKRAE